MTTHIDDKPHTDLVFWHSEQGQIILATTSKLLQTTHGDTLRTGTMLRKKTNCSPEQAAEALEISLCREKARTLGKWTERGFFTRQSLEQATEPLIADYHAERFRGKANVLEICSGAGFDTAALARAAKCVTSIEANERLAAMARYNLALQGINNVEVICGLAEEICKNLDLTKFDALWSDPSRRTAAGERIHSPDNYAPSLPWLQSLPIQGLRGIKIAPAVNCEAHHLHIYARQSSWQLPWQREWLGFNDECREQVLWYGLEDFSDGMATLILPNTSLKISPNISHDISASADTLQHWRKTHTGTANLWNGDETLLSGMFLIEPHATLIRTGHLAYFFAEQDFMLLDKQIAFGIARTLPPKSEWYQSFEILEAMPFHYTKLRERLQSRFWGNRLEIKKRGFPEIPEEIRKKLKLPSSPEEGVLICTRRGNKHLAILARRLPSLGK